MSLGSHNSPIRPELNRVQLLLHLLSHGLTACTFLYFSLTLWAEPAERAVAPLTRADQIRQLTPEQAAEGHPVCIRGVITNDVPAPDFFIQDSTAGIYVEGSHAPTFVHHFGDMVEVKGITGPGRFAPVIHEQKIRVLGRGTLPAAKLYAFSDLADGQMDSQWVQVRGIVRSASVDRTSWRETTLAMRVASGGGEFNVRVPIQQEQDPSSWIDSEVLIEGVCGSLFTSQRQLTGVLFYVPRLSFIRKEATTNEVPFSSLLRFSPGTGARHRVRVRGVVTHQQLGNALFLQSEGRGLRVLTQQDTPLQVGDMVEVFGFPVMGESAPVLADAVFHRVGHTISPTPINLRLDLPWERYDGALITTDAVLLDRQTQAGGQRLLLRAGDNLFEATLSSSVPAGRLASIPLNSTVHVVGICLVRSGGLWSIPQSFRVLLRSPQDISLVQAPSWWNLRHTLWVLGLTATVLLIVLAWVVVLGRRLREQVNLFRQKLRSGAVLEERNRIARELHDTLEQGLAGITLQLDLAADCFQRDSKIARHALDMARNMSRHSMIAARRSVWDLRCHLLENGDLVSALTQAIEPLSVTDNSKLEIKVEGEPRRLGTPIEMNLLRIGQEAVTNAVKHASARHIHVGIAYHSDKVCLSVIDDGRGFSLNETAMAGNGHFGLVDIRERAQSLGCYLQIDSKPGLGTQIRVEVPDKAEQSLHGESEINTYTGRR